jgi:hypothetical protein
MSVAMIETTRDLVHEMVALVGCPQRAEIGPTVCAARGVRGAEHGPDRARCFRAAAGAQPTRVAIVRR